VKKEDNSKKHICFWLQTNEPCNSFGLLLEDIFIRFFATKW